ncbi:MAG: gliding motility-associated C-terminal domain-containing protein [Chitinophagales bacterium]|nr:gliding motility-associated C-terminal domain-containing protein [Chitinophagales bacterium]
MRKHFLLFLFISFFFFQAEATHIVGGFISYRYISGSQYELTMKIYRDCNSATLFDGDDPVNNPVPAATVGLLELNGGNYTLVNTFSLVDPVIRSLPSTSTNPCLNVPPGICVEEGTYTYTFTVPDPTKTYMLVYERCCRNGTINNLNNPGNQGTTYTSTIPPTNTYRNSSPSFNKFPPTFICANSPLAFDNSASDLNGDSLVYGLCTPNDGASQSVPAPTTPTTPPYFPISWQAPYNQNDPLGGVPLNIDPTTGLLTGTPSQTGAYVVGICISEYRNGVLIGSYIRDFQFIVSQCDIPDANMPFLPGTFNPSTGIGIYENQCSNLTVDFSKGTSFSPAPGVSAPLKYYWDFGVAGITTDTSTKQFPVYTFPDTGSYTVMVIASQVIGGQGCYDTARAIVRIYPTLTPDFSFTANGCQDNLFPFNDATVSTASAVSGWSWNFGDGFSSTAQNPKHQFAAAGTFNVKLTVTNKVGCVDTVSHPVTVYPMPIADFNTSPVCLKDTTFFTNLSSSNSVGHLWNFGNSTTSTDVNPFAIYATAGAKTVTLIATTADGCKDTLQRNITVNPLPVVSLGTDTTICPNTALQLNAGGGISYAWLPGTFLSDSLISNPVSTPANPISYVVQVTDANGCKNKDTINVGLHPYPNIDAGLDTSVCLNPGSFRDSVRLQATGGLSYVWTPASGLSSTTVSNPMCRPTQNEKYFVTGTDFRGCKATDSVSVFFLDPSLNLIIEDAKPICDGDTTTLTIVQQGPSSTYSWAPPTGLSNATSNTPLFFPNDTTAYIFTVRNYCYQKQDTVTIIVHPLPNVGTTKLDSVCIGDSIQLNASGAIVYEWKYNLTLSDTTIANPIAKPDSTTKYYVTGTDAFGCRNSDSITILVYLPPITVVLPDTSFICLGQPVELNAVGGVRFLWQNDPTLSSLTVQKPIATPTDTTTYYVRITNIHNCYTDDSVTINVQLPVVATSKSPYDVCEGKTIQLESSGGLYYRWSPPTWLSSTTVAKPTARPLSSITYVVEVANDCFSDTESVNVIIRPTPTVDAGLDTLIYRNTEAELHGISNANRYYWTPSDYLENPFALETKATPLYSTAYYLFVISDYGCTNYDSVRIIVEPKTQVLLPTGFSPNGDGVNDIFRIMQPTLNLKTLLEFSVYNRWGEKVFSTADVSEGWNGTFKGVAQEMSVYVWYLIGKTYDGETVYKKGNVTLVR